MHGLTFGTLMEARETLGKAAEALRQAAEREGRGALARNLSGLATWTETLAHAAVGMTVGAKVDQSEAVAERTMER